MENEKIETVKRIVKDWGFEGETATALTRLIMYAYSNDFQLSREELEKWRKLNIIDANGMVMVDENPPRDVEWILFGLAWEGMLERVGVKVLTKKRFSFSTWQKKGGKQEK